MPLLFPHSHCIHHPSLITNFFHAFVAFISMHPASFMSSSAVTIICLIKALEDCWFFYNLYSKSLLSTLNDSTFLLILHYCLKDSNNLLATGWLFPTFSSVVYWVDQEWKKQQLTVSYAAGAVFGLCDKWLVLLSVSVPRKCFLHIDGFGMYLTFWG